VNLIRYEGEIIERDYSSTDDALSLSTLNKPLAEELEYITGRNVTVRYWLSKRQVSFTELKTEAVKVIMGGFKSEFYERYSEYTGYLWTTQELMVGGHDLLGELETYVGYWLVLEIELQ
jgi:hypothetical protein